MKKVIFASIVALNLGAISLFAASGSTSPTIVDRVMPAYPVSCIQAGVQGRVMIEGLVNIKGELIGANVIGACDPELAAAAVQAVSMWKFAPATKNGLPADAVVRIPIEFKIETNTEGRMVTSIIAKA
jgi:periplasmic protein TonB